ncbi:MAG: hypothetical protein DRJ42_10690 [Deltaproteobacteria bacterium]|nr:MAG: hypothetical protein DRJ42_10690 [Deltaproteobacteria bacterium]
MSTALTALVTVTAALVAVFAAQLPEAFALLAVEHGVDPVVGLPPNPAQGLAALGTAVRVLLEDPAGLGGPLAERVTDPRLLALGEVQGALHLVEAVLHAFEHPGGVGFPPRTRPIRPSGALGPSLGGGEARQQEEGGQSSDGGECGSALHEVSCWGAPKACDRNLTRM